MKRAGIKGGRERGKATQSNILAWRIPWTVLEVFLEWWQETLISLDFCRGPEGTSQGVIN